MQETTVFCMHFTCMVKTRRNLFYFQNQDAHELSSSSRNRSITDFGTHGQEWYAKAVERGATVDSVDQDFRNISHRADQAKQAEMREFLLRENAARYAWLSGNANTQKRRAEVRS